MPRRSARPVGDPRGERDVLVGERHDGRDVERADARVGAAVAAQVDAVDGLPRERDERVLQRERLAGEGDDAAVVVRVGVDVEHPHPRQAAGVHERVDRGLVPAFADVRHREGRRRRRRRRQALLEQRRRVLVRPHGLPYRSPVNHLGRPSPPPPLPAARTRGKVAITAASAVGLMACSVTLPYLTGKVIDDVLQDGDRGALAPLVWAVVGIVLRADGLRSRAPLACQARSAWRWSSTCARGPVRAPAAHVHLVLRPHAGRPAHVAGDERPADRPLLPGIRAHLPLHAGLHPDHGDRRAAVDELAARPAVAAGGPGAAAGDLALQPDLESDPDRRAAAGRRGHRAGRGERGRDPRHQGVRPRGATAPSASAARRARAFDRSMDAARVRPLPAAHGLPAAARAGGHPRLRGHPHHRRHDEPRRLRRLLPLPRPC